MKEHLITALVLLPFYVVYAIIGTVGYLSWKATGSPEDHYRMIFGWVLLGSAFLATIIRLFIASTRFPGSFDYQYTIVMTIVIGALMLPLGFFLSASIYGNMFNFDDPMYRDGVLITYIYVFLIGSYLTSILWKINKLVAVILAVLMIFVVLSISCLIYGAYYNRQEQVIVGFIFLGATFLDLILLLIALCYPSRVTGYETL